VYVGRRPQEVLTKQNETGRQDHGPRVNETYRKPKGDKGGDFSFVLWVNVTCRIMYLVGMPRWPRCVDFFFWTCNVVQARVKHEQVVDLTV
jgi:hypothetical protein